MAPSERTPKSPNPKRSVVFPLFAVSGALLLSVFSTIQKLAMKVSLQIEGFITPIVFGAASGLLIAFWYLRQKDTEASLREGKDDLERRVTQRTAELEHANAELERVVLADGLTGIANRRCFDNYLDTEWKRMRRAERPISIVLGDIDFFKAFNDSYGHLAGDDCLRAVAGAISDCVNRPADLTARYGGEEFALILPETDSHGAKAIAACILEKVRKLGIRHAASDAAETVTISLGVATAVPGNDSAAPSLVDKADSALYRAKENGRNRYAVYGESD